MLIDTKELFKCETCRHHRYYGCNTCCDHMEDYSPDIGKLTPIEQPKWISCEERLPENGEIVLCITTYHQEVLQWDARANKWLGMDRPYSSEYVTHWMPLPEPPKGDE